MSTQPESANWGNEQVVTGESRSVRASTLYIVSTPIGNLGDITARALDVLRSVDVIFAEDTRHSGSLLQHFGVKNSLRSLHEHNETGRIQQVEELLNSGGSAALISDAGTPLISDPGYRLVAHCHQVGLSVSPVPGVSALITALSVSGLPTDSFTFLGFPPARQSARREFFSNLSSESRTLVFYESRHRILATIDDMRNCFGGDRIATMARELTKNYETIRRAALEEVYEWVVRHPEQQKGEFVIVVDGAKAADAAIADAEVLRVLQILLADLSVKQAASLTARITGCKRKTAYTLALSLREER